MKIQLTLTFIAIIAVLGVSNAYGQVFEQHLLADSLNLIEDIAACDLDLDGDVDVLCCEVVRTDDWEPVTYSNVFWWENDSDGSFSRHTLADDFKRLQGITPMDFDGDGDIDILLAGGEEYYDEFSIMENTGELNFERHVLPANFDEHGVANEIKAADLNGDGSLDVVVAFLSPTIFDVCYGGIKVYFQTDPFTFDDITLVDYGDCGWRDLFLLDFDQNGAVDVIATDNYFWRRDTSFTFGWWANTDGEFEYNPFLVGMYNAHNYLVDLNQDGRMDIINFDTNDDLDSTMVTWMENLGGQRFEHNRIHTYNACVTINSVSGDFDLDDDLDFVTWGFGLEYYENDGNEQFESRQIPRDRYSLVQVITADITGNGRLDLVARNWTGNYVGESIYWFENVDERSAPLPEEVTPTDFALTGAYPNPFNATTTIGYSLPAARNVSLAVYDLSGREVARLADGVKSAGTHEAVWTADGVGSGVYMVALDTGGVILREKVVLVK